MDEYLRRLERSADGPDDERRLARARFRAGKCSAHGIDDCPDYDCATISQISQVLRDDSIIYKWGRVNFFLHQRGLQYPQPEIHTGERFTEDVYRNLRNLLDEVIFFQQIWFPTAIADDFITAYKLAKAPYCGKDSIQIRDSRGARSLWNHLEALNWEVLINAIYYPEWSHNPFINTLDYRIIEEISKQLPPLEIEQILTKLPLLETSLASELLEKARVALFIGEDWCGEAMLASGKNQEDWFRLGCKRYPKCYDPDFCDSFNTMPIPNRVAALGTSRDITVHINIRGDQIILQQQLNSQQVVLKMSSTSQRALWYRGSPGMAGIRDYKGLRNLQIKIDEPLRPRDYRRNPWYDDYLTGDLYRGTITGPPRSFNVGVLGAGVYLAWDKNIAESFARIYADKYDEEPVVSTYRIVPNLNILERNTPDWKAVKKEIGLDPWEDIGGQFFSNLLTIKLKERGYDGVISSDPHDGLVIFDSRNVIGYIDPTLCEDCGKRKLMCEKCGHLWCHMTCDSEFEECPNCSICKECGSADLDECYECGQQYCTECHYACPQC